jgi:serine/threonine protein kinase
MAAFRNAVRTLQRHYDTLPPDVELVSKLSHPTIFPYPTSFTSLDDNSTVSFKYREHFDRDGGKSKRLVFFGTITDGEAEVAICIKFVSRYSRDAHMHCARSGVAPRLRGFERLPGGWYMVVMDRLAGYHVLADLSDDISIPRAVFNAIGDQLKALHAQQLVHGDIRDTNILLKANDRTQYMIIDFDWAGVDKVVRYPAFVNHRDIQRPDGARDGLPIEAAHDDDMLGYIIAGRFQKQVHQTK